MDILINYDFKQNQLLNAVVQPIATLPADPKPGQIYFNTVSKRLFYHDGTNWVGADARDSAMTGASIVTAINGSTSTIADARLSQQVRDAISKSHNTHAITDITGLQTALDLKLVASSITHLAPKTSIPTKVSQLSNDSNYVTSVDISGMGLGDMLKSVYDTNGNGVVDNAEKVNGFTVAKNVPANAEFTDTKFTLMPATASVLGGVMKGQGVSISPTGVVSVDDDGHAHSISKVTGLQSALNAKETPAGALAKASTAESNANGYTDTALNNLVGAAPAVLDTLVEIAQALGDDPNFAATMTQELGKKTDKVVMAIGNGSATSYDVPHNLGTRDVVVLVRQTGTPYEQVITNVAMTTLDKVVVSFAVAPSSNEYTVTVIG